MIVLFDAVGTVIKPRPSVASVYHRLGQKFGSQLTRDQIKHRIKLGRRRFFNVGQPAESLFAELNAFESVDDDLCSSEEVERALWRELVFEVFVDVDSPDELFDELWDHFRHVGNWEVYSDVEACFEMLHELGIEFGLASNFDSRLISISEELGPLAQCDYVFCSSQVGFRKPSPSFYQQIDDAIRCVNGAELEIVMVGDDLENDCVAPHLFGWKSLWLNRQDLQPGCEQDFGSQNKREVSSLYEFTHWLVEYVNR